MKDQSDDPSHHEQTLLPQSYISLLLTGPGRTTYSQFAHGAMGRQIDPSWGGPIELSRSSQCPTTGVTKAVVCAILSVVHIKEPLLLIGKSSPCGGSGFPLSRSQWSFTICPTSYNSKIKCVECVVK